MVGVPADIRIGDGPPHPLSDWFDHHRENRRRARRDPGGGFQRPSRAVMTMSRNESFFLPLWLRYYSRFFEPSDIYVLDHDSTDGSTDGDGFVRIPAHREKFDNVWQRDFVAERQSELLERYDAVLYCDTDELVVPHPSLGDLGDYIDRFEEPFVHCLGYEIIHLPDREPPLDPDRPILEQRGYWCWNAFYNKAALTTEPVSWAPGFHRMEDFSFTPDPDLFLVHLHRVDWDQCRARHATRTRTGWSEHDLARGWGTHNHIVEEDEFRDWFFRETGMPGFQIHIEEIPEEWRGAF